MSNKTRLIALTAMFIALVFVVTAFVKVPVSFTNGYKNLGDAVIFLSSLFFGPFLGFFIGGTGSMLADVFLGYTHYAIPTFIVKGIEGFVAALIYRTYLKKKGDHFGAFFLASLAAGLWMCLGYFLTNTLIFGRYEAALMGIPGNLAQAGISLVAACLIYFALKPILNYLRGKIS